MKTEKDKKLIKQWKEEGIKMLWEELDKLTKVVKAMSDEIKEKGRKIKQIKKQ